MKPIGEWTTEELTNRLVGKEYSMDYHKVHLADVLDELLRRERKRCVDEITHSADWCGCEGWCNCQSVIRDAVYQIESLT